MTTRKLTYMRHGEPRTTTLTARNEMRLSDALDRLAVHGLTQTLIYQDIGNPFVLVLQDWWPNGRETAVCIRTRGKYRGQSVGFALRPEEGREAA